MSYAIPDPDEQHGVVSARDAALALGRSERTIRRAIARGELAAFKQGRAFHITAEALARYRARLDRIDGRSAPATVVRFPEPATPLVLTTVTRASSPLRILPAPLSRFIGREREVAAVSELLRQDDTRLVTLIGPGGVGKTRLALRVAEVVADEFRSGVVFVPLAAVGGPALVLSTIARALEVREAPDRSLIEVLVATLANRHLLLVLDNIEHVLEAASSLADLLQHCPGLTLLVTSREPLHLSGEHRFPLSPLALPGTGDVPEPERLSTFEAIAFFLDRARQVQPGFALNARNAAIVHEICRRLEGLPLALELAAPWLRALSPTALLARLERRLPLLTGGSLDHPVRLRTMRDAIAWSYDLLAADEQRLLRRLAVFSGEFTLDAAEWVGEVNREDPRGAGLGTEPSSPDSNRTLALLAALVDKSLLQVDQAEVGEHRFLLLETVREFALERLATSGEEETLREAHASHYLALAETAARDAGGAGDSGWMRRLTSERANLRAAVDWLEATDHAGATLQITGALWHYWYRLGDLAEGRNRLERALAAAPPDVDPVIRARALRGAGVLAWQNADYGRSRERLEAALVAFRALGDQTGIAWCLNSLGCLCATLSDADQAETYLTEALEIFRELDNAVGIANLTSNLGELAVAQGDDELAIARLEAGLAMWRALGDRVGAVRAMVFLGQALLAREEVSRAEGVLMGALAAIRDIDYKQILPAALRATAHLATRRGDDSAAARWYGAAEGVMAALGMELPVARRAGHERAIVAVRENLGEAAFAAAWDEGRADPASLVAISLVAWEASAGGSGGPDARGRNGISGFTSRQHDVLHLMAQGRTDKEIADALFISRTTASKHVAAILTKLEVDSRTAAVAIAVRHGLA
jgi:non-specific serine/threonine protein kinase